MTTEQLRYNDGDIIELRGYKVKVEIRHDPDSREPWKECEGYGVLVERGRRYSQRDKRPYERPLGDNYWYDMKATRATAERDSWGWGCDVVALATKLGREPTRKQIIAEAIERDYQFLLAWINDEWQWHGYIVTLLDVDGEETEFSDSCWGFEYWLYDDSKNQYFFEMIRGAAEELVEDAEKEARAIREWNERDVMTEAA